MLKPALLELARNVKISKAGFSHWSIIPQKYKSRCTRVLTRAQAAAQAATQAATQPHAQAQHFSEGENALALTTTAQPSIEIAPGVEDHLIKLAEHFVAQTHDLAAQ